MAEHSNGVDALIPAVARYGLLEDDAMIVADDEASAFVTALEHHRILGLGVRAVESGWLGLGEAGIAQLSENHQRVMAQVLRVELEMLEVAAGLESVGVDYRILKGPALAARVAVDPADRDFRDLDLLVPANLIGAAVKVVTALGGTRMRDPLRPDFDERFGKSVTMKLNGIEIDIHRVLAPGPFGAQMHPAELFVVPDAFSVADRSFPTLDSTDHLLHACYHAALGQERPALANLRDIAILARTEWDRDRLADTVRRWSGRPALARAVGLVNNELGVELRELDALFPAEPGDDEVLAPYLRAGDRFSALAAATLRVLPVGDRLAFARAVGLPDGSTVVDRTRDLVSRKRWRSVR